MPVRTSRIVPLVIAFALFMENLDSTIISTSIPAMAADFGVSPVRLNIAITAYLLAMAVFIPASGWLADRFGARRVFVSAIALFLLGSIGCGAAPSFQVLVIGRLLQGIGGAMMVPVGRLILLRAVARNEFIDAMAWFTVPGLLGPILGPPVGGFITTFASWRWIFWINVPIGLLGIVAALTLLPKIKEEEVVPFDIFGFLASAVALAAFIFAFEAAGAEVISLTSNALILACGVGAAFMYIRHARRHPQPLIDLDLLRIQTFRAAVTGGSVFRIGVGAVPFLLPLQLQLGFGQTALQSGLTTLFAAAGALLMKMTASRILKRYGYRRTLTLNALIAGSLLASIGLIGAQTPALLVMPLLLAGGFFRSLEFTAINTIAFADIDEARMSRATSFSSMMQQLSLSAGVAFGALTLHLVSNGHGHLPSATHFSIALLSVGLVSMLAAITFHRLPEKAGSDMLR